ncbi:protein FAM133-like protein [Carex littledalei]|uniref:Protein FAM133-like protein n=1 Tax=Carex littledalei TaxID=544730 RepID=A0A833VJS0_9POAL|nr:protein FAM133-like protein [Carex littledalei]
MSAVTGSIVSSKSISLSRAARTLRKFVESDTAAKPDIAAYLRRTSAAFNDLIEFHNEIKHRKYKNAGIEEMEEESCMGLGSEQCGGDDGAVREVEDGDWASEKKKKKKKRKRENVDTKSDDGFDQVEKEINSEADTGRKKKKRKHSEKQKKIEEN